MKRDRRTPISLELHSTLTILKIRSATTAKRTLKVRTEFLEEALVGR